MLNGLSLFSGIRSADEGLMPWVRTVAYCDIDRYCQVLTLDALRTGSAEGAGIFDDVALVDGLFFPSGSIDIIHGGFPCQDISTAGPKNGLAGKRSRLFWEIRRLTDDLRPEFVFLENVPAITYPGMGGLTVVGTLTEMGYDCRWCVISVAALGGGHIRERWFLLAHDNRKRLPQHQGLLQGREQWERPYRLPQLLSREELDPAEAIVGREISRFPYRTHRIKCLGNTNPPALYQTAFVTLMGLKKGA